MSVAEPRPVEEFSCRCRNILIKAFDTESLGTTDADFQRVFVGESGIHIIHHCLTLRTRDRARQVDGSPTKSIQHLSLSCLACRTHVYRVAQEISPGMEAREGPILPSEDWYEEQTLCSKHGWVEVFRGSNGCLVGSKAIIDNLKSYQFSDTLGIAIISPPPLSDPSTLLDALQPWAETPLESKESSASADSLQLLPNIPPLFPPPPFTPSHPVFTTLASHAINKSTELRRKAEEEVQAFVKSLVDSIQKEESKLRIEVEGVWRGYREGYKELMGRVNEERRRSMSKPQTSSSASGVKSGVPMSIRDFSPILSHPVDSKDPPTSMSPSTSLLSATIVNTDHSPSTRRQGDSSGSRSQSSSSRPTQLSNLSGSYAASSRSLGRTSPVSLGSHGEVLSSAFKRNMDTNVDIASSVKWAEGEEEMRRRFAGPEKDRQDRARRRTSKNLGIVNATPQTATTAGDSSKRDPSKEPRVDAEAVPTTTEDGKPAELVNDSESLDSPKKGKRRVTFDVNPETTAPAPPCPTKRKPIQESGDAMVELFDLDDDFSTAGHANQVDIQRAAANIQKLHPIIRNPSYKLKKNARTTSADYSQAASLPVASAIPSSVGADGSKSWFTGSLRPSSTFTDAFPLLSSSVPAKHRIMQPESKEDKPSLIPEPATLLPRAPSPAPMAESPDTQSPTEDSTIDEGATEAIKNLLAGSAPSHRHAWKKGGKAWDMFRSRSKKPKRAVGAIAEEGSEDLLSALDDESDDSSEQSPNGADQDWQNPSRFASSLPVQIRPLLNYQPTLEPKTSLADRQGVLVPPLNTNKSRNSSTAIRKAVYAERDRARAIDPGPTLDLNDLEETEEDEVGPDSEGDNRGRRHALSILQARSVVPEAGMWRSMAS